MNPTTASATLHVVGAAIISGDTVLCAQRGPGRSLCGYWEFPGGKVKPGETQQEALRREIKEELLCDINVGTTLCTTVERYAFGTIELTTFLCSLTSGTPKLSEHQQLRWMTPDDFDTLLWAPADREAVRRLATIAVPDLPHPQTDTREG